jgi:hypothetical protein
MDSASGHLPSAVNYAGNIQVMLLPPNTLL